MGKILLKFWSTRMGALFVFTGMMFMAFSSLGQPAHQLTSRQEESLKTFLQDYMRDPAYDHKTKRCSAALVDLKDGAEARQAIVYLTNKHSCGTGGCAQGVHQPAPNQDESLKKFLLKYLGPPDADFEKQGPTRYYAAFVDLKDDGTKEVIVYVTGQLSCGSGGCTTLVLAPEGSSYKVVTELTITRPPILVLTTMSQGWHDIAVWMQGGGIQPGYEAELSFNGKTYVGRDEPTLRPSKRLTDRVLPGKVIIPLTYFKDSKRLYP
jgi:hypothetical protein